MWSDVWVREAEREKEREREIISKRRETPPHPLQSVVAARRRCPRV